jgi:tryptophan synthase alpha chain
MNRLRTPTLTGQDRLRALFGEDHPAVIAYVPFGDPLTQGEQHLDAYCDAGVSVLEIGMPTRDAYLDGPEVGDSMRRALEAGASPRAIAERLARWRAKRGNPAPAIVWMGYPELDLASIEFAADLGAIDGLLMVDEQIRPDAAELPQKLEEMGTAHCAFVSWDATEDELRAASTATGYVMVQARPGPTGTGHPPGVPDRQVDLARRSAPGIPVVAGFGVQNALELRGVARAGVDGIVVGSACVRALSEGGAAALSLLLESLVAEASMLTRRPTLSDAD